jgi:hypothetical protein
MGNPQRPKTKSETGGGGLASWLQASSSVEWGATWLIRMELHLFHLSPTCQNSISFDVQLRLSRTNLRPSLDSALGPLVHQPVLT